FVPSILLFLFKTTVTTEIYTLSLHDALPISTSASRGGQREGDRRLSQEAIRPPQGTGQAGERGPEVGGRRRGTTPCGNFWSTLPDRKSTRLNSSHVEISYAVFCLKKKKIEPR